MTFPFIPGDRVIVFDPSLWAYDTPTNEEFFKPATVICHYGYKSESYGNYPSLIDVRFDHDGRLSTGHFTEGIKYINEVSG